ncbi:hypothetical protein M9458_033151, partial [Cirrhinus mrigala]
ETSSHFHSLHGLHIPSTNNWTIYQITTIQGLMDKGLMHHRTPEVILDIGCLHSERISLLVLEEANVDIVLGCPWLTRHDPIINWKWSSRCYQECLKELPKPVITTTHLSVCSTSVESPNSSQTLSIPPEYQAFQDVFSKVAATHLPPHRPWDCAYPLSIPERAAMEEYIQEALQQGFIHPSTSPAKKDGGLRPCNDYRALNEQTVKFAYPLPLVPTALEEFNLDLRSTYNLIRIRMEDRLRNTYRPL